MWRLPEPSSIFVPASKMPVDVNKLRQRKEAIETYLADLGIPVEVKTIRVSPTITTFGLQPGFADYGSHLRIRAARINHVAGDLAMVLRVPSVRVLVPMPGTHLIGLEVPNEAREIVYLANIIRSTNFRQTNGNLLIAMGISTDCHTVVIDLVNMPHLLVAGSTGSGKSVFLNVLITCLLCTHTPDTLRLVLVDPKRVELTPYNGLPHLALPVLSETNHVLAALRGVIVELERRYRLLAEAGVRNIAAYNTRANVPMPYIVLVIDELADLMMAAHTEVERAICRLAQVGRAAGLHVVIATQRPSVDVVTGLIKANFPARIACMVQSNTDSRVILDLPGAERLLGNGDMLFLPPGTSQPIRLQGCFISDSEIARLCAHWRHQGQCSGIISTVEEPKIEETGDVLLPQAMEIVRTEGKISASLLQRRLHIGYNRAARLVEEMAARGVVVTSNKPS